MKLLKYTKDSEDIFEHIVKEDNFEFNHVVIKAGFHFPAHPTDADVIITVVKGRLSVKIENEARVFFNEGQVISLDRGIVSELGNDQVQPCELFVIKRR